MDTKALIQFIDVSKNFGQQTVLKNVNLSINKGEITTIIGMSGVGKSVLLKHIIGLITPDSGEILYEGKSIFKLSRRERSEIKRKFSYMFQGTALFDSMTVFDNIALPLKEKSNLSENTIHRMVMGKMEQLDIREIADKFPAQLSGGMQKRVALARALVTEPEIVLFDEPTTGLDPIRRNAVHSMISDYQQKFGFTGIVVSHSIPEIFYISQKLIMLHEGSIIFEGAVEDLQKDPDPIVTQFISGLEIRHDPLTGLLPQTRGEKRVREELARLQRHDTIFSIIVFRIKELDEIRQKSGHMIGQTLLKHFSEKLRRNLRITDICFRYDFNKIIAVMPNTELEQAKKACRKLSEMIDKNELKAVLADSDAACSINVGFAEAKKDLHFEHLIKQAESNIENVCFLSKTEE